MNPPESHIWQKWRELVERQRQRAGGLSMVAFCQRNGIAVSSLYAWRRRLAAAPVFVEAKVADVPAGARSLGVIEVRLRGGKRPLVRRESFERLAELAASVTGDDPPSGHLVLFRSRCGVRIKILYWDTDGCALWYKRLEEGTFKLPKIEQRVRSVQLRASELAMMLDGIDLKSVKRVKRFQRKKD